MGKIKVAIAGVGNCASSLIQGIHHYGKPENQNVANGLMQDKIGPWRCSDIDVVAAFDIDARKVNQPLHKAIFAKPNCTQVFAPDVPVYDVIVQMAPVLDGYSSHMKEYPQDNAFQVADQEAVDVIQVLRESKAEVLVCYLPVGSEKAVKHFAEACLAAKVAMVNCVPVFIASNPEWAERFRQAGVPIVGDDIKSQVGATIVHRALTKLFDNRGVSLKRTYQLNTGGNTDFLNMLAHERLKSKKISKTQSVNSQLDTPLDARDIHIGPSDYVPWQEDNKLCFIRMEGEGFGGQPLELELRLSVQDSPNSAGVVVDAIRSAGLAVQHGLGGPIESVSAYFMKSPPVQIPDPQAHDQVEAFFRAHSEAEQALKELETC
ncbi:Inositol-3-phosphate synthase [Vibrio nigripulchritudo SOn1]|uniref:Inositol-3-phosphate synthase n=1 Tax=Vibrio nigripulchritudo SOn1 TaxID=1238450 RepID=A0AAV2VQI1_9VIBR|nr:inositol-3-phosphate synthase [Vibrio nigripulchritudo]CCO46921.1 Inositol-3-phosphate synthase [Vibrio nigripulchritudo SOn1]